MKLDPSGVPVRSLLLLSLFAGCGVVPGFGGQEGEDLHDTSGSDDIDSGDADTDVDDDTATDDTDDSDTADTAGTPRFVGPFVIDATELRGTADRCVGTVTFTVTGTAVSGEGACFFEDELASSFPLGVSVSVDGTDDGTGALSGTTRFTSGLTGALPWTGALTATTLTGTFSGDLDGAPALSVVGTYDTTRE